MTEQATTTLVIGYGNDLRRDDAAGRRAAERVAARRLPGVRVLSVPQLAPEHVVDAAACALVVFVDASAVDDVVTVRAVAPAWPSWRLTHHLTPASLLGLVRTVGGAVPNGVVVTIPVSDDAMGLSLSPRAAAGVRDAVEEVVRLCTPERSTPPTGSDRPPTEADPSPTGADLPPTDAGPSPAGPARPARGTPGTSAT